MLAFDLDGIGMTSRRTRERLVRRLEKSGIRDSAVLDAMAGVPRHIFIDEALAHRAYEDSALPIGLGQTISQPFIVALMTSTLLDVPRKRILEIGTGSGYQTAVLSSITSKVEKVFSIERLEPLIPRAKKRLRALKITNVRIKHADGYNGWPEEALFDGILVTAAPRLIPEELLCQLTPGGRLVAPVGEGDTQELRVYDRPSKGENGDFVVTTVNRVRLVPLVKGIK